MLVCARVIAGLGLLAPIAALAQQTAWREPIYAEVVRADHGGSVEQVPFYPYQQVLDSSGRVMRISSAGTEGVVLAGSAQLGDGNEASAPTTPYVAKLDARDGHALWSWQPDPVVPPQGRLRWSDVDADGAVFVAGSLTTDDQGERSLLVKLDGATGAELWRVVGEPSTVAYMFAFDAAGSVVVTSSAPNSAGQQVAKFATADGSPGWSHLIEFGIEQIHDFRLAVRSDGDVFAAGSCFCDEGDVQVVRLGAEDGAEAWRYVSPDMEELEEAQNVVVLGDDVLVASRAGRVRLGGADGAVVWQQSINSADFRTFDVIADAAGRLFVAGSNHVDDTAVVRRYDPATGDSLWEAVLSVPGDIPPASTWLVSIANDGSLLPAWYSFPVGAASVDAESGAVGWSRLLDSDGSWPVGIEQAPGGAIFVGAYDWAQGDAATWILFKLVDVAADTLFKNGFD
jgi:putative pyrroloquinoline-quinone binding quinoprotein